MGWRPRTRGCIRPTTSHGTGCGHCPTTAGTSSGTPSRDDPTPSRATRSSPAPASRRSPPGPQTEVDEPPISRGAHGLGLKGFRSLRFTLWPRSSRGFASSTQPSPGRGARGAGSTRSSSRSSRWAPPRSASQASAGRSSSCSTRSSTRATRAGMSSAASQCATSPASPAAHTRRSASGSSARGSRCSDTTPSAGAWPRRWPGRSRSSSSTSSATAASVGAAAAAALLAIDFLHLVQSRVGMLDAFIVLFVVAALLAVVLDRDRDRDRDRESRWWRRITLGRPWRLAAGVFLGAAAATKWSGAYVAPAVIGLVVAWEIAERRRRDPDAGWAAWVGGAFRREALPTFVVLGIVPLLVYVASYTGRMPGELIALPWVEGSVWRGIWEHQRAMLDFHTALSGDHPYQSPPWSWPLIKRPVAYWFSDEGD